MRYIDQLPDPPGEAAVLGTFVHQILEDLLNLDAGERSVDTARDIARKLWDETLTDEDFVGLCLSETETKSFMWKVSMAEWMASPMPPAPTKPIMA